MCCCVLGCVLGCCYVLSCFEGEGWLLQHVFCGMCRAVPRARHGDPVFPHFCPLNQDLACEDKGVGVTPVAQWPEV